MLRRVVLGIEADTDKPHVFGERYVLCAEIMKLTEDARSIGTCFRRGATGIDETQKGDASVRQVAEVDSFVIGVQQGAIGGEFYHRQSVAAGQRRIVVVIGIACKIRGTRQAGR